MAAPIWLHFGKVFGDIFCTFFNDVLDLRFDVSFVAGLGCFLLFVVLSLVIFLNLEHQI